MIKTQKMKLKFDFLVLLLVFCQKISGFVAFPVLALFWFLAHLIQEAFTFQPAMIDLDFVACPLNSKNNRWAVEARSPWETLPGLEERMMQSIKDFCQRPQASGLRSAISKRSNAP
jgi:hypothetical protein